MLSHHTCTPSRRVRIGYIIRHVGPAANPTYLFNDVISPRSPKPCIAILPSLSHPLHSLTTPSPFPPHHTCLHLSHLPTLYQQTTILPRARENTRTIPRPTHVCAVPGYVTRRLLLADRFCARCYNSRLLFCAVQRREPFLSALHRLPHAPLPLPQHHPPARRQHTRRHVKVRSSASSGRGQDDFRGVCGLQYHAHRVSRANKPQLLPEGKSHREAETQQLSRNFRNKARTQDRTAPPARRRQFARDLRRGKPVERGTVKRGHHGLQPACQTVPYPRESAHVSTLIVTPRALLPQRLLLPKPFFLHVITPHVVHVHPYSAAELQRGKQRTRQLRLSFCTRYRIARHVSYTCHTQTQAPSSRE